MAADALLDHIRVAKDESENDSLKPTPDKLLVKKFDFILTMYVRTYNCFAVSKIVQVLILESVLHVWITSMMVILTCVIQQIDVELNWMQ